MFAYLCSMIRQEIPEEEVLVAMAMLAAYPPWSAMSVGRGRPTYVAAINDPRVMQWVHELGARRGDACAVLYDGNRAVGAAWTRLFDDQEVRGIVGVVGQNSPALLSSLLVAVAPEHQGKGYGAQLIASLAAQVKSQGFPSISLSVSRANSPALALYHKTGFVEYSSDEKSVLMIKHL
jgi:ribosomal protein S18 acetylase RimI-like enzyme